MRVLYLSESTLASDSADSVHVVRMASAMVRAGHDVALWGWRGASSDDEMRAYYGAEPELRIIRSPAMRPTDSWRSPHSGSRLGRLLWLLRRGLFERPAVRAAIRSFDPDLVYSRNLIGLLWVPKGTPTVFESHHPPVGSLRRAVERWALTSRIQRLVLISEALHRAYAVVLERTACDVIVAHDAADDPFASEGTLTSSHARSTRVLRVGYVGHLYPGRGAELLVEMMRRVDGAELHFVGGTPEDVERMQSIDRPGGNVFFHGHQPPSALAGWYSSFDVLVAPYQRAVAVKGGGGDTSAFMSPMKLFEYMSWGRAIIFSDLPVIHEVLKHDQHALLVAPDDVEEWVSALIRLRDEPGLADRLGRNARNAFLAEHTWDERVGRVLAGIDATG